MRLVQLIAAVSFAALPGAAIADGKVSTALIHTEGDSYMAGAYGINLNEVIASRVTIPVVNTAVGRSSMAQILERMASAPPSRPDTLTIIWDGSPNRAKATKEYIEQLQGVVELIPNGRFIIIPPMVGSLRQDIAHEAKALWPDNVLDWRDVLGDHKTRIQASLLAFPSRDHKHLNAMAVSAMADAIIEFARKKNWL